MIHPAIRINEELSPDALERIKEEILADFVHDNQSPQVVFGSPVRYYTPGSKRRAAAQFAFWLALSILSFTALVYLFVDDWLDLLLILFLIGLEIVCRESMRAAYLRMRGR